MVSKLQAYPAYATRASELAKDAAALVEIIKHTPEGVRKLELVTAYTDSLRTVYIVMCALAGVCLVASLAIKGYDLNVGLETEQGLILEKRDRGREGEKEVEATV